MQTTKGSRLPCVASKGWADEDVETPWNQSTADGEDENGVECSPQPLNDGTSAKKEKDD